VVKLQVKIKGLKEFTKALSQYPDIAGKYFAEAIKIATWQLERDVKRRTPVATGILRATIYHSIRATEGRVYPTREYAPYVHEGTRFQKAQPFLEWGIRDSNTEISKTFENALEETLNEIAKRS